jgi:hypothetical protein
VKQIKNGKTLFDLEMMKSKYTNPFLKNPQTSKKLQEQIKNQEPLTEGNPVVNFIETSRQPLLTQEIKFACVGKDKMRTTGKSWMPTGDKLVNFSNTVNKGIKAQQKYASSVSPFHTMSAQEWESLELH